MMDINRPEIVAELTEAFLAYEAALVGNDIETLDRLFWASPEVVRYGPRETLYGRDEILAFRKARPSTGLDRTLVRTVITTFGTDYATAFAEFRRPGIDRTGRQSQSWARLDGAWRIVAAHVSFEEI
jgi:hypothetical protein